MGEKGGGEREREDIIVFLRKVWLQFLRRADCIYCMVNSSNANLRQ